ncbi:hypothetical protein CW304_04285 [Bacillus sp. UFRGS-B20]|nr:hypothetical protein CW304_04285 [Bacillus sp. UFRGS-B20]
MPPTGLEHLVIPAGPLKSFWPSGPVDLSLLYSLGFGQCCTLWPSSRPMSPCDLGFRCGTWLFSFPLVPPWIHIENLGGALNSCCGRLDLQWSALWA